MIQRLFNGVRYLDGIGPSPKNVMKLDHCAVPMISYMKQHGMQVDPDHFKRMEVELVRDMDEISEDVRSITGYYCNLDSGDQVADLLFKKLGLKQARLKMTKSGDRESVEDEVLTAIQHDHIVVPKIQDYKELSKLLGTYVRPMPILARRVGAGEYRMFPNLGHTTVPSGRLNCFEPNLLAMPTRTERGRDVRRGYGTKDGWVILSVDQSQIEVRVAAHRSEDENLIKVYEDEQDIYYDFATSAFKKKDQRYKDAEGWHYPGVSKDDERRPAKTCVLASIYDVTNTGLLEQMPTVCANCNWSAGVVDKLTKKAIPHICPKFISQWNENNCQDLINAFYMKYPGLMRMRKKDHRTMMKHRMIWDDWGRMLHSTAVCSVLEWVVSAALREGSNMPLQGTAQGTMKITMGQLWDDWEKGNLFEVAHFLLQVHDEILFEVREDIADEVADLVKHRFENCVRLRAPIKASAAKADTWGNLPK